MRTINFFRVAMVSLLLLFVSCDKESDVNLSIGDLVGTWRTDYFEEPPLYGPITVEINNDYTLVMSYLVDMGDGNPFLYDENCQFSIDGDKIILKSEAGYMATIKVFSYSEKSMMFNFSREGLNLTLEAKRIK